MNRVGRNKDASVYWSAARNEESSGPADQPLINRRSTACQPRVLFLHRFIWDFLCSCFRNDSRTVFFESLEGKRKVCLLASPDQKCTLSRPKKRNTIGKPGPDTQLGDRSVSGGD